MKSRLNLVHGWACDSRIWSDIFPTLKEHFEVNLLDLPGYGSELEYDGEYSLDDVARALLDRAPQEDAHWIGWSLGATVSIQAALMEPSRFQSLQLISPTPKYLSDEGWSFGNSNSAFQQLRNDFQVDYESALAKFVALQGLMKTDESARNNLRMIRRLRKEFAGGTRPSDRNLMGGLEILAHTDLRNQIRHLKPVTQVIAGKHDHVVPCEASRFLFNELSNSHSFHEFETGHLPFLQCTSEYIKALLSLVDNVDESR